MEFSYIECIYQEIFYNLDIIDIYNFISVNKRINKNFYFFSKNKNLLDYTKLLYNNYNYDILINNNKIKLNIKPIITKNSISFIISNPNIIIKVSKYINWVIRYNNNIIKGRIFVDPHSINLINKHIENNNILTQTIKFKYDNTLNEYYYCLFFFKIEYNKPVYFLKKIPFLYTISIFNFFMNIIYFFCLLFYIFIFYNIIKLIN